MGWSTKFSEGATKLSTWFHELKPHPLMKDSGVKWLGEVPQQWELRRLKHLVRNVNDQNGTMVPDEIHIALENIESWTGRLRFPDTEIKFESKLKRFKPGDILFSKLRPYLAKVTRPNRRGVCVGELLVLRVTNDDIMPEFLEYKLRSSPIINLVTSSTFGAKMPRADWSFIGNIVISFPPDEGEQSAIVRFIDYIDRRTLLFIRAKRRLVELLNEQKQVIIRGAMTRGLDAEIRLKQSKISWLGHVPQHWIEKRAKYAFREVDERTRSGTEELLSVSHITGVSPRSQKNVTMFMAASYVGHKLCQPGDLVINTMWAWAGALGIAYQPGIVSPSYAVYRLRSASSFLPEFLDNLLRTQPYRSEYLCRSTGIRSSRLRMYPESFLQIPLIQPPLTEQERIISFIQQETRAVNSAITRANHEVDLILEYRATLISDVIMGRVDARGIMLQEPEEPESRAPSEGSLKETRGEEDMAPEEESLDADE